MFVLVILSIMVVKLELSILHPEKSLVCLPEMDMVF